jgi:Arc/MetJ-type ribon-helix-helix transcriptional regulator
MKQRNISMTDELWKRVKQAALQVSVEEGEPVSASEIVRRAVEDWLERHKQGGGGP